MTCFHEYTLKMCLYNSHSFAYLSSMSSIISFFLSSTLKICLLALINGQIWMNEWMNEYWVNVLLTLLQSPVVLCGVSAKPKRLVHSPASVRGCGCRWSRRTMSTQRKISTKNWRNHCQTMYGWWCYWFFSPLSFAFPLVCVNLLLWMNRKWYCETLIGGNLLSCVLKR